MALMRAWCFAFFLTVVAAHSGISPSARRVVAKKLVADVDASGEVQVVKPSARKVILVNTESDDIDGSVANLSCANSQSDKWCNDRQHRDGKDRCIEGAHETSWAIRANCKGMCNICSANVCDEQGGKLRNWCTTQNCAPNTGHICDSCGGCGVNDEAAAYWNQVITWSNRNEADCAWQCNCVNQNGCNSGNTGTQGAGKKCQRYEFDASTKRCKLFKNPAFNGLTQIEIYDIDGSEDLGSALDGHGYHAPYVVEVDANGAMYTHSH